MFVDGHFIIYSNSGGDFARALRSHNLVGWAVSPRKHLLESYYLHLSISNLFNRNKSGRCAPWKSKEIRSYESMLSRTDLFVFTDFVGDLFSSISRCKSSQRCSRGLRRRRFHLKVPHVYLAYRQNMQYQHRHREHSRPFLH